MPIVAMDHLIVEPLRSACRGSKSLPWLGLGGLATWPLGNTTTLSARDEHPDESCEGMNSTFTWLILLLLWPILTSCGYVYFRLAPLDPHNPARLPRPWLRAAWSAVASTALIIAPAYEEPTSQFFASLAVGMILGPGLNDPYYPRQDEDPSWLGRYATTAGHRVAGSLLVKLMGVAVAWISSLLWPLLWMPLLAAVAGFSIQGRTGALILRGTDPKQVEIDLQEVFRGRLPPMLDSLGPEHGKLVRSLSDRQLRKHLSPSLAEKLIQSKRLDQVLDWYRPQVAFPRLLATLGGLVVWISLAHVLILASDRIEMDATNFNGAYGFLLGLMISLFFEGLRR